jgi:maleate isomerase
LITPGRAALDNTGVAVVYCVDCITNGERRMKPATRSFPYTMETRLDASASIGVIALATDATIEREWRALLDTPGVGFYVGRLESAAEISPDSLRSLGARLSVALDTLLPDHAMDCIVFACTSASMFIGEEKITELIQAHRTGVPVTNPMTASKSALRALGASRIALLTPYLDEINLPMVENLETAGFEVVAVGSFFNKRDPEVVRINNDSIRRAALALLESSGADALFVACTALGASSLVAELEHTTGVPVTTSNHAMAWHALRLCGFQAALAGRGTLFTLALETASPALVNTP